MSKSSPKRMPIFACHEDVSAIERLPTDQTKLTQAVSKSLEMSVSVDETSKAASSSGSAS